MKLTFSNFPSPDRQSLPKLHFQFDKIVVFNVEMDLIPLDTLITMELCNSRSSIKYKMSLVEFQVKNTNNGYLVSIWCLRL
jgi:hypothetical protein